ncbi:hypothetical protein [Sphingopyxis alaskensis]|uniref:hypothetical protein n=1 Tax=Sphingopyxis alaskensis TaxID=117207 RepID=UPI002041421E|nr:hypothetical protein [Sphingopyxis alaskensis]MCM3420548.1 hypothetical protein [Sphingopyxis alaskensis]
MSSDRDNSLPPTLNIYQALIWVRYRDVSMLHYRERPVDRPTIGPPSVGTFRHHEADADQVAALLLFSGKPITGSARDLESALTSGKLTAHGRKESQQFEPIPAMEWTELDVAPRDPARQWPYETIRVNSVELLGLFPFDAADAHRQAVTDRPVSTSKAESQCRTWLVGQFEADAEKRRPKAHYRNAALAAFAGKLSKRGFDLRVWPDIARQHGRDVSGAKKKKG